MAIIGDSSKPNDHWEAFQGSSQINQGAELLTMPKGGTINSVGQWIGGWSGACDVWLTVWSAAGARPVLGQSNILTVASQGAGGPAGSNVQLYVASLRVPVDLPTGADFLVGFVRKQGDGHQISFENAGQHWQGRSGAAVQDAPFGVAAYASQGGRIGAYVADYQPRSGAWIYRAGAWVQSDQLLVFRSGQWVEADTVNAFRSGAWNEAD
jgi:hypothetical protein